MVTPAPPQRSVFAVWRWKWWAWCVIVALVVAVYLVSPVPILYFTLMLDPPDAILTAEHDFTAPVWWMREHTDAFEPIDSVQREALKKWFGPWNIPPINAPPRKPPPVYGPGELVYPD